MDSIHIDGSHGEGGGQVLRTSLSMAALLGCELSLTNIRAGREKPGLAAQHVTCVRAAAAICGAEVSGDQTGSGTLHFIPGPLRAGEYTFDVADVKPSAGSVSLVLQTVLPPLLFAGAASRLTLRGGTNVPWSPCFEYIQGAFVPAIRRMGVECTVARTRGGWYPRGGGEVTAQFAPLAGKLSRLDLHDRGPLTRLEAISTISRDLPDHIASRQLNASLLPLPHEISRLARRQTERPTGGPGTCLALVAEYESGHAGFTSLGERGKPAEQVGDEAAQGLVGFLQGDAAVDVHLADQLLLYAALAEGESTLLAESRSLHLETNAWVIEQFLGRRVALVGNEPVRVDVEGVGLG